MTLCEDIKLQNFASVITIYHRHSLEIVNGTKRFENRPKAGKFRGLAFIHMATRKLRPADRINTFVADENRTGMNHALLDSPNHYGHIVGVARVIDCMSMEKAHASDKFTEAEKEHITGPFCWLISEVEPLYQHTISFKGGQGAFRKMKHDKYKEVCAQF
jgi:hypothetical protein